MRERRKVPAGADRAAAWHDGVDAAIEQVNQPLEGRAPNSRVAFREHVGAQSHCGSDGADGKSIADASRVAAQEVDLERTKRIAWDRRLSQRAEPGVDAIDGRIAKRLAIDDGARRVDARGGLRRQGNLLSRVRDSEQVVECQARAVEKDCRHGDWHCGE